MVLGLLFATPDLPPQQQPLPRERPIWAVQSHPDLTIRLMGGAAGNSTTEDLCRYHIPTSRASSVEIKCDGEDSGECSDSDLVSIGTLLSGFHFLSIRGPWSDEKASVFLREVPETANIRGLTVHMQKRIPVILTELQRGRAVFASLNYLALWDVELNEEDCDILGEVLPSQEAQDFELRLLHCTFPSLRGYLVVADALIKSGHRCRMHLWNTVVDATIPVAALDSSTKIPDESHRVLLNVYAKKKGNKRFEKAAREHMEHFSDLNLAGRLKLTNNSNTATVKEWVDALCHDHIRGRVDYLFHFLTMNPEAYAKAALRREGGSVGVCSS